jgi:4-aminobutyrate aminotransferase-like enzyme
LFRFMTSTGGKGKPLGSKKSRYNLTVIGKKEIMDSVHPSGIGGAYSGNPLVCEVDLAVCDIFEMKTSAAVKVRGLIILACGTYGNVLRFNRIMLKNLAT